MSGNKKQVRQNFRDSVFKRDGYRCRVCQLVPPKVRTVEDADCWYLDAHHITGRNDMPNGGYVKENGISLCPECHMLAERFLLNMAGRDDVSLGPVDSNFDPFYLYKLIGSSYEEAVKASEGLRNAT